MYCYTLSAVVFTRQMKAVLPDLFSVWILDYQSHFLCACLQSDFKQWVVIWSIIFKKTCMLKLKRNVTIKYFKLNVLGIAFRVRSSCV